MIRTVRVPEVADLDKAWTHISAVLPPTPLDKSGDFGLKLETLQPNGSFKIRGAIAAMQDLPPDIRTVAASAGNHALGVAAASARLGMKATVVVPGNASPAKVEKLRAYDSIELIQVGTSYDEAEKHALSLTDGHYLSPYNDPDVIAGQGTIGYELERQIEGPLTVVCAVGGGGLAAGLGLWASQRRDIRIAGVESAMSTAVSETIKAGHDIEVTVGETLADGITGNLEPGSVTVGLIERHVHQLVTVTEDEIKDGIRYMAAQRGIVVEGSAAAAVGALLHNKVEIHGRPIAIVSGRNIAMPVLAEILAR